jgi:hypothetical protein
MTDKIHVTRRYLCALGFHKYMIVRRGVSLPEGLCNYERCVFCKVMFIHWLDKKPRGAA